MPGRLNLVVLTGHPDFLDLPWDEPLASWEHPRLVRVVTGLHRHVVRFVSYDEGLYALKELPAALAAHEFDTLTWAAERRLPAVTAVGGAYGRFDDRGSPLEDVLITAHLSHALPYRALFSGQRIPDLDDKMLEAFAELLVRLHLAGLFWGDCSLSNTLFRRDAGLLSAYLVDTETSAVYDTLSDGQREQDLTIAEENVLGELLDLDAAGRLSADVDPVATVRRGRDVYQSLWNEIRREEVFGPRENYRIHDRLRRINEMGFDVERLHLVAEGDGYRLRFDPHVVEPGHHSRRLAVLTGLDVGENQARRMLNDIELRRSVMEAASGRRVSDVVSAYAWLTEVYDRISELVPTDLRGRLDAAEVYHQVQEHRWYLSERAGHDVGLEQAASSYVADVLRHVPDETLVVDAGEITLDGD